MKLTTLWLAICLVGGVWAACQSNQQSTDNQQQPASTVKVCYAYLSVSDTVQLMLVKNDTVMTGELLYQLAEKDRNSGTLTGRMRGDTLLANYRFQSEGVESEREVAFLLRDNKAIEGFGPVVERAGKMIFVPSSRLTFTDNRPLVKVACTE